MWCLGTWFTGALGSVNLVVLDGFKVFPNISNSMILWFYDLISLSPSHPTLSAADSPNRNTCSTLYLRWRIFLQQYYLGNGIVCIVPKYEVFQMDFQDILAEFLFIFTQHKTRLVLFTQGTGNEWPCLSQKKGEKHRPAGPGRLINQTGRHHLPIFFLFFFFFSHCCLHVKRYSLLAWGLAGVLCQM